jgi:hypothetical protein
VKGFWAGTVQSGFRMILGQARVTCYPFDWNPLIKRPSKDN